MNENDEMAAREFAREWKIETLDLRERVQQRIADKPAVELLLEQVLAEIRLLRAEVGSLRNQNAQLVGEVVRLRSEVASLAVSRPGSARITPFLPPETFARLS